MDINRRGDPPVNIAIFPSHDIFHIHPFRSSLFHPVPKG